MWITLAPAVENLPVLWRILTKGSYVNGLSPVKKK